MRRNVGGARRVYSALSAFCRLSAQATVRLTALVEMLEPHRFAAPDTEAQFLRSFRLAGLPALASACCAAVGGYLLIGCADIFHNGWSSVEATRRLLPMTLLTFIVILVVRRPTSLLPHYKIIFGGLALTAYVCSVAVTHLHRADDPTAVVNPTSLIGLWIIYGFVRLPLLLTVTLCAVGGAFTLLGSRVTNMPDPVSRTMIYLFVCNTLGAILARSIEVRERELFRQRGTLEHAHAELNRRNVMAEQASEEKSRLIAAVGHDLRQPMMAATIHLSVLMSRVLAHDSSGVQRQSERVLESVNLLKETLEHLLLSARYEAGLQHVDVQVTQLSRVFEDVSALCGAQLSRGNVELCVRRPKADVMVATDKQILLRALVNLVSNALKFARSEGDVRSRVVVRAMVREGVCKVVVVDNGIGIAGADAEEIWKPFSKVGESSVHKQDGLGLGLYLVRQSLLQVPGHKIGFSSRVGKGTRFTVFVPTSSDYEFVGDHAVEASDANPLNQSLAVILRGAYVLVIEDDLAARDALHALLQEWGVLWSSGSTMSEAWQAHLITDRRVDAIIADFGLPGRLNGIECILAIREALGYSPVSVLLTAEMEVEPLRRILPEATTLVQKPFESDLLQDVLNSAVTAAKDEERRLS